MEPWPSHCKSQPVKAFIKGEEIQNEPPESPSFTQRKRKASHLADLALLEDRADVLLEVTAIGSVVHGVTRVPEHDTGEALLGLDGVDEIGHLGRLEVVWVRATLPTVTGGRGRRGHTEVESSALGGTLLDLVVPVIPGLGDAVGVVGGAGGVVVELDVELVELAGGDHVLHIRLSLGALRSAGDDVLAVGAEVLAQSVNGLGIDLIVVEVADFNVKVEAVQGRATEGLVAVAAGELVPERISELLAVTLLQHRVVDGTANGSENLLAIGLTSLDILADILALVVGPLVFSLGVVGDASPVEVANRFRVGRVAVLVDEGKDDGVDTLLGVTHIAERLLQDLTPVDDLLEATSWGGGGVGRVGAARNAGCSGQRSTAGGEGRDGTGSASKGSYS